MSKNIKSRPVIICANWKMHKTIEAAKQFIHQLPGMIKQSKACVYIAPSYTALYAAALEAIGSSIVIGAQNMWFEEEGSFTGEVSGKMLLDAGARFVIIGHSERRRLFNETDELINKKVFKATTCGLEVILCVGEDAEQRHSGKQREVIEEQIALGLKNVEYSTQIFIAYEPTWAIGTGKAATPEVIQEMHLVCRESLIEKWGEKGKEVSILYGGSVNAQNAKEMIDQPDVNGLLVGTASLSLEIFSKIVNYDRDLVQ